VKPLRVTHSAIDATSAAALLMQRASKEALSDVLVRGSDKLIAFVINRRCNGNETNGVAANYRAYAN